jgi:hypothetical protein
MTPPDRATSRWLVRQIGARMHYAVPAILARRGMLAELWTDMDAEDWPARLAQYLPESLRTNSIRGLLGRRMPPEISRHCVRSFPVRTLWHNFRGLYMDSSLNRQLLKRGFGAATGLYSLMFGDADIIAEAKRRGLFVAFEQVTNPERSEIAFDERAAFPGIEAQADASAHESYLEAHRLIWRLSDLVISPSHFVTGGVARLSGDIGKTRLIPYALDPSWFHRKSSPRFGRVLCVGAVCLSKGSHYLAMAARILRDRKVPCEIRVVGAYSDTARKCPLFDGPTYTGAIPRNTMREEYLSADVFVLPTLYEGSATAHIEALACGLPVVTTPNCGTLIQDGVEGFLVPIRDATALAGRIEAIITNRQLRDEMGSRARELALREHSWERYEERLLTALGTFGTVRKIDPYRNVGTAY